jgi:hypothetical protein
VLGNATITAFQRSLTFGRYDFLDQDDYCFSLLPSHNSASMIS